MKRRITLSFTMTKREMLEFLLLEELETMKKSKMQAVLCVFLLFLWTASILIQEFWMWAAELVLFMILFYTSLKSRRFPIKWKMILAENILEITPFQTDSNYTTLRMPSSCYYIRQRGHMAAIVKNLGAGRCEFAPVPLRSFSSEEEKQYFFQAFQGKNDAVEMTIPLEELGKWDYSFSFDIGEEQALLAFRQMGREVMFKDGKKRFYLLMAELTVFILIISCIMMPVTEAVRATFLLMITVLWASTWDSCRDIFMRMLYQNGNFMSLAGHYEVRVNHDRIAVYRNQLQSIVPNGIYTEFLEGNSLLYLFDRFRGQYLIMPKILFGSREEADSFIDYCRGKGISWRRLDLPDASGDGKKSSGKVKKKFITVVMLCSYAAVFGGEFLDGFHQNDVKATEPPLEAPTESPFVFDPADYPDYVPFDRQVEVIRSLGIEIPESDIADYQATLAEDEEARVYIEGFPYAEFLSYIGYGLYDSEADTLTYSDSVYSFDFEGWDISEDYIEILMGIRAIGRKEFLISDISEDTEEVNWEQGTGTITVTFRWNHRNCRFHAEVDNDWIDGRILEYVNRLLKQDGSVKRIYAMPDNGQGVVLFYNTPEWAREFEEKTGIKLQVPGEPRAELL